MCLIKRLCLWESSGPQPRVRSVKRELCPIDIFPFIFFILACFINQVFSSLHRRTRAATTDSFVTLKRAIGRSPQSRLRFRSSTIRRQTPQKRLRSRQQNLAAAESGFKIRYFGYEAQLTKFEPISKWRFFTLLFASARAGGSFSLASQPFSLTKFTRKHRERCSKEIADGYRLTRRKPLLHASHWWRGTTETR